MLWKIWAVLSMEQTVFGFTPCSFDIPSHIFIKPLINLSTLFRAFVRLAPITEKLKYATLAGSHLTQVLRLWHSESKCDNPRLAVNGHLSRAQLKSMDAQYYDAVENGMIYDVIDAEVIEKFALFPQLCQSAENAKVQACISCPFFKTHTNVNFTHVIMYAGNDVFFFLAQC